MDYDEVAETFSTSINLTDDTAAVSTPVINVPPFEPTSRLVYLDSMTYFVIVGQYPAYKCVFGPYKNGKRAWKDSESIEQSSYVSPAFGTIETAEITQDSDDTFAVVTCNYLLGPYKKDVAEHVLRIFGEAKYMIPVMPSAKFREMMH